MSKVGKFLSRVNKGEVEKRKAKERQQEQLMELAVDAGMTYATRGTNKIGSGAAPKAAPTPKKAKGGKADSIEYKKVFDILKENIDDTVEDLYSTYEGSERAEGEEVESKSRDGFIPYANGGYYSRWFEYSNQLEGSGIGLPTKSLDDKIEEFRENNREYARERFEEDYPEIVQELGIENIEYGSLYDAGYSDEAEELDEYERDDDSVMMEIQALYYSPDNDRAEDGKHTIRLSGVVNLEAPYHRTGNLEDFIEKTFTFSSYKDLEDKLEKGLSEVLSWFEGDMYSKKSRELKIRRMAKGGEAKKDDKFIQKAVAEMEKKGTKGAFTKKANRQDMSVKQFTKEVLDNPSEYDLKTRRQAQFVKNVTKYEWGGKVDTGVGVSDTLNKAYEYAKGGVIPFSSSNLYFNGFGKDTNGNSIVKVSFPNSRAFSIQTNGDLPKTHSLKQQYSKIENLSEKDLKVVEKEVNDYVKEFGSDSQIKKLNTYAKGGTMKKQGYNDKLDESLSMRKGKASTKKQSDKDRRDESKGMEKSMGKRAYASVGTMDKMAKGGKTQGYNDKLDESLGNRKGKESTKKQSLKDRRDESKGEEKALGKRAYSSVSSMDKLLPFLSWHKK